MVVGVEGTDDAMVTIDESAFESFGAASGALAVWTEAGSPGAGAGAGKCFRDEEVHGDAIGAQPPARVVPGNETAGSEEVADQRPIAELSGGHGEVGIRRVFRDCHVGIAGMEIDGLSANEDYGVAVVGLRFCGVEQGGASPDVERVRRARRPRSPASRREARLLGWVPAPVR